MRLRALSAVVLLVTLSVAARGQAGRDVIYRVTFPSPEHHWMQVEATFADIGAEPLRVRMSRSSPGRYAVHDFAKNIFSVEAFDGTGRPLPAVRSEPDEWTIAAHNGEVRFMYRIFGDHADGTYLGIDPSHAHLNMPAAFVWAVGLELRPITITFVPPLSSWTAATQLLPTSSPLTFTAPNLQYFMDSPTELAELGTTTFQVTPPAGPPATFAIAAHAAATPDDLQALASSASRLIREHVAVFGEFPAYEPGHYTFLLEGMSWAFGDAMEHRNSTSVVVPGVSLGTAGGRQQALDAMSHEFFHGWNVERIRPAGIEPFDFTKANVTCCLWLAEGFTQYYGDLLLHRAGLSGEVPVGVVDAVVNGSGRRVRSAVEMSEYAPYADAAVANDQTDQARSFVSYYTFGAAVALAMDLSLRDWSRNTVSLDDYMRRLWSRFGRTAAPRPGYVAQPYTLGDLRTELANMTSPSFANEFFDRFIVGREVPDFVQLLSRAGFVVRPALPGRGWIGEMSVSENSGGLLLGGERGPRSLAGFATPLYDAGLDSGDVVVSIDGRAATRAGWDAIAGRRPGDTLRFTVRRRSGRQEDVTVQVVANPRLEVLSLESAGKVPTTEQVVFRRAWLGSRVP